MSPIGHHVHIHLAGAAAGIDLFGRSGPELADQQIGQMVLEFRDELVQEREQLLAMAERLGVGESVVMSTAARLGERLGRLKPNGDLLRRTPLTDLLELEAMRDAVAGKIAGWEALLAVVDQYPGALDRAELEALHQQAEDQHAGLSEAHRTVAARVLVPEQL